MVKLTTWVYALEKLSFGIPCACARVNVEIPFGELRTWAGGSTDRFLASLYLTAAGFDRQDVSSLSGARALVHADPAGFPFLAFDERKS